MKRKQKEKLASRGTLNARVKLIQKISFGDVSVNFLEGTEKCINNNRQSIREREKNMKGVRLEEEECMRDR